jgi:protein-L-isoaspartate(D-aspartate) O-methyltransferase
VSLPTGFTAIWSSRIASRLRRADSLDLVGYSPHHPSVDRRRFLTALAGALALPLAAERRDGRMRRTIAISLSMLSLLATTDVVPSAAQDGHSAQRARMVAEIAALARETGDATGRPRLSNAVMTAMGKVPRHRFVPSPQEPFAYQNRPLPIGEGQTISQPFIVALMTDLLDPRPGDTVLEVGTGSGYQAAVLAELVAKVYTIEIVEPLGKGAAQLLDQLGYRNVEVRIGDGFNGWPEAAPFDAIVVTAAPAEIPKPLIDQLKPGGRMVLPAEGSSALQYLLLVEKRQDGTTTTRRTLPVSFVPLTRDRAK